MIIWAVTRPTRGRTEFTNNFYTNEARAERKAEELNEMFPRGARYQVSPITVRGDEEEDPT